MSKQPQARADRPASGAWQWGRTAQTQRALLDAARQVFTEQGFTHASIADVVERAGSSVGSLYHHFGGKSELFLALWQEHQQTHEEAASKAVAQARRAGVTDTTELFCTGARAFLEGSWLRRDLALLFVSGDGPPGFEVVQRHRGSEWVAQNDALLGLPDTSLDRLYAAVLTSLIGEGAREVAAARNRRQANGIIDAVIGYARRLMAEGVWRPAARLTPLTWRPWSRTGAPAPVTDAVAKDCGHRHRGHGRGGSKTLWSQTPWSRTRWPRTRWSRTRWPPARVPGAPRQPGARPPPGAPPRPSASRIRARPVTRRPASNTPGLASSTRARPGERQPGPGHRPPRHHPQLPRPGVP